MILVRAPLRISFVGGGTDLPAFYRKYPGKVISVTINKFVYVTINPSYHPDNFIIKYNKIEIVKSPDKLKHDRFRVSLTKIFPMKKGLEISSLADLPAGTGLGSSSSFSCALLKGLNVLNNGYYSKEELAQKASELEIDLLGEPIGKQDQYAAAYGGFNVIQFNPDESVEVTPLLMNHKDLIDLNKHFLLFYTGITRSASEILSNQQQKIEKNFETYKKMSDSVDIFKKHLLNKDFKKLAEMLSEGWLLKKSLSQKISTSIIDKLYERTLKDGAWGGKILGAGGGGCILVMAKPSQHEIIRKGIFQEAKKNKLKDFQEIDFSFTQSGTDILFNNNQYI